MRRTVIALLLLVSGAAAAVAQPAKQNPSARAPKKGHCAVGVMSHLGEKFNVWKEGRGTDEDVPVESWHLDDLVVDRVRGALGKRAAVRRIPYRKKEIAWFNVRRWLGDGERLRTLAAGWRCARYIVVTAGKEYYGNGVNLVGFGMVINTYFGSHAFVYALISLRVYDSETFAPLRAKDNVFRRMTSTGLVGPHRVVDESFWPDPPSTAAQNAKLREAIREMVARNLDAMLPELPLTP